MVLIPDLRRELEVDSWFLHGSTESSVHQTKVKYIGETMERTTSPSCTPSGLIPMPSSSRAAQPTLIIGTLAQEGNDGSWALLWDWTSNDVVSVIESGLGTCRFLRAAVAASYGKQD